MNKWAWAFVFAVTGMALVVTSAVLVPKEYTLLRAVCLDLGLVLLVLVYVPFAVWSRSGGIVNRTPRPGSWSLREADQILALKDPETRQRTLRDLRRARWLYLPPAVIFVVILFLQGMDLAEFLVWMLLLLVLFNEGERRIQTILILDLLVFPASNVDKS